MGTNTKILVTGSNISWSTYYGPVNVPQGTIVSPQPDAFVIDYKEGRIEGWVMGEKGTITYTPNRCNAYLIDKDTLPVGFIEPVPQFSSSIYEHSVELTVDACGRVINYTKYSLTSIKALDSVHYHLGRLKYNALHNWQHGRHLLATIRKQVVQRVTLVTTLTVPANRHVITIAALEIVNNEPWVITPQNTSYHLSTLPTSSMYTLLTTVTKQLR